MIQRVLIEIDMVLQYFTDTQTLYIKDIIDYSTDPMPKPVSYFLFKCVRSIDETTTEAKKEIFIQLLEQIFVKDTLDNVETIHAGENLLIEVFLKKDEDFTGSIILARDDSDNMALSSVTLAGTDERIQQIMCLDLELTPLTFHRINVLAESIGADGVSASGDSNALLNIVYLYVEKDIDND